eukprot:15245216-Alexandrium_andersonii.AAC.1
MTPTSPSTASPMTRSSQTLIRQLFGSRGACQAPSATSSARRTASQRRGVRTASTAATSSRPTSRWTRMTPTSCSR